MSTSRYKRLPNATRIVKYAYLYNKKWEYGQHICFEKTDEGAINSCYNHVLVCCHEGFHITEIVTSII